MPLRSGRGGRASRSRITCQQVSTRSMQGLYKNHQGKIKDLRIGKEKETGKQNRPTRRKLCSALFRGILNLTAWLYSTCVDRKRQYGTWQQEPDVHNVVTCSSVFLMVVSQVWAQEETQERVRQTKPITFMGPKDRRHATQDHTGSSSGVGRQRGRRERGESKPQPLLEFLWERQGRAVYNSLRLASLTNFCGL